MKYTLIRDKALNTALNLYRRGFHKAYVSETGIYPFYEYGLDSLKQIMVLEPSCICDLSKIIAALRSNDDVVAEVEHIDLPKRILIDGVVLYPSQVEF